MIPDRFVKLRPIAEMEGEDAEDTLLLRGMYAEARAYLSRQRWCASIADSYWGAGIGGVVAVFLFDVRLTKGQQTTAEWVWTICGDLPSMYLDSDVLTEPLEALRAYCNLLDDWIAVAKTQGDLRTVIPIAAEPTPTTIAMLESRLQSLRDDILPALTGA